MNITITGNLGSGKTSVCRELQQEGFTVISAGDIFREIAAEKGMTVIELNEAAKKDRSIDDMLDNRSIQLGREMDHTVFDSRLAWHFVEHSFKVFLLVDIKEAAERVYMGVQRSAEVYQDVKETQQGLCSRAKLEQERFSNLYGIDYYDGSNYDLIIESSCAAPREIAREIIRNFEQYQQQPFPTKTELNMKCLYPTKKIGDLDKEKLEQYCEMEKNSGGLCAGNAACIQMHQGFNYLIKGHHGMLAAAAAGKVFAEVQLIQADGSRKAPVLLPGEDYEEYARAAGFSYGTYPGKETDRAGYMLDFSHIN